MAILHIPAILRHPIKIVANSFTLLYFILQLVLITVGLLIYARNFKESRISKQ